MFSFKGYSSSGTNTHLEHLEDSIINDGAKGGRNAVAFLKSLQKMLVGNSSKKVISSNCIFVGLNNIKPLDNRLSTS